MTGLFLEVMLPIALLVAAGGLWPVFARDLPADRLRVQLNRLVLFVFAPALMFSIAASTPITGELLAVPAIMALGMLAVGLLLFVLLYRSPLGANLTNGTRAALLLGGTFGNIFYLGYPIVTFLYGPEAGRYPAFVDMLCATPLLWTLGVWVALRLGRERGTRITEPFWRVLLRLPPVWAFVLGVAVNQSGLALEPLMRAAAWAGAATIPVMMFVVGLSIPWRHLRPGRALLVVTAVKLLVMPLVVWVFARTMLGTDQEATSAALIEAGLPTMLMAILMADRFGLDTRAAGLLIGWSTVLYWFTLPVWLWVIT